ncbi:dual specificity protein phosphatase 19-like [Limulus polyphemus]|uniref:Dual specificity protein phosphatase 19-like n=1 Tax=Limulus polyphemus TaxID=6850 RepID=A0ABM1BBF9_LIMPO|nr:dual specificity protein phosphatase 19-like [Limulus polyphemus]XP_013778639.1 dual specificity protein phosphatase 19-like [Limulus polyphemus]XP_022246340.1 dual specificity protein phosphatase 19-like [Limulus polyphemus]XP_022246341.1 dual specificity protein phosphatase 19-like [Limulus polyphemus]XP_022246342.1 dual specificity protein phosphatase 19-like [Limulus polyphemus]XP_022246343.1 dual specificity protein phosphatase 19-like [Limulus polyphemus]
MEQQNLLQELQELSSYSKYLVANINSTENGSHLPEKRNSQDWFPMKEERCLGYRSDIRPDLHIFVAEVIPRLFIGSQDVAEDLNLLHQMNVTHILNVATGVPNVFEEEFIYKRIGILDLPEANIRMFFDGCFQFIDDGLQEGGVLVHCNAGVSRSATLVIGYLMNREKLCLDEAFGKVKSVRPFIKPNVGFMEQLRQYEKELYENAID